MRTDARDKWEHIGSDATRHTTLHHPTGGQTGMMRGWNVERAR